MTKNARWVSGFQIQSSGVALSGEAEKENELSDGEKRARWLVLVER